MCSTLLAETLLQAGSVCLRNGLYQPPWLVNSTARDLGAKQLPELAD